MSADLELIPQWQGKNGVAVITAKLADQILVVQKIDTSEAEDREKLITSIVKGRKGLDRKLVAEAILRMAADHATKPAKGEGNLAEVIVSVAEGAALFHDQNQNAYARVKIGDHREIMKVKSKSFRLWLRRCLKTERDRTANAEALQQAIEELEAKALFDGPAEEVFVRLAEKDGKIYLDLGDDRWRVVEVDKDGWRILDQSPVNFIRPAGMLPLCPPARGGTINDLRPLLNTREESDFILIVAWLIASLRPRGPYPVLLITGEAGSAKSTCARLARDLVDPNSAALRAEPKDAHDLVISASNGWIISLDNLSHLPGWLSDCLCRLSTGGGFSARTLYTDNEETIFSAKRPTILNGITDFVHRSDLYDRAIAVQLSAIPENARKTEGEVQTHFESARPGILGALLDAVSHAIRTIDKVKLPRLPRLADFAVWVASAEGGLGWKEGTFLSAYEGNRTAANASAIEASPIGASVLKFMEGLSGAWEGTASDLLHEVESLTFSAGGLTSASPKPYEWPRTAKKFGGELRRIAQNLRAAGYEIVFTRGSDKARTRSIRVEKIGLSDVSDKVSPSTSETPRRKVAI